MVRLLVGAVLLCCLSVVVIPAHADEDDDPNERVAMRLTETNKDGIAAVLVGRLTQANAQGTFRITARIDSGGLVVAESGPQLVAPSTPVVIIDDPSGMRFTATLDASRRTLRATLQVRGLAFDKSYVGTIVIQEQTSSGLRPRLTGNATVGLTGTVVGPPPTSPCTPAQGYTTICEVQFSASPDGQSPLLGQTVTTRGRISGQFGNASVVNPRFFIQDGAGPWSGVWVRSAGPLSGSPDLGSSVEVTGTVAEFGSVTQVDLSSVVFQGVPPVLPLSTAANTQTAAEEALEGVLVTLQNVVLTALPGPSTNARVSDAQGEIEVDFSTNSVDTSGLVLSSALTSVTGISHRVSATAPARIVLRTRSDLP